jgi:hypothetical protein
MDRRCDGFHGVGYRKVMSRVNEGESFHHRRLNLLDDNRARSYHYQIYAPLLGCLDPILSWVAIDSSQPMQESPGELITAWTNVYMCLFI